MTKGIFTAADLANVRRPWLRAALPQVAEWHVALLLKTSTEPTAMSSQNRTWGASPVGRRPADPPGTRRKA